MAQTGRFREGLDKFYTAAVVAKQCVDLVKQNCQINKSHDIVIEPSAGNGSFIRYLKPLTRKNVFIDIAPESPEVQAGNFFQFDASGLQEEGSRLIVIGNPPFGRQASLAVRFIKHAASFADVIAFILPRSFMKDSMKAKVPRNFHLVHQWLVPNNAFVINNTTPHDVPCVFQIWERRDEQRSIPPPPVPEGYRFVPKTEPHQIAIRRIGVYAGRVLTDTLSCSTQSHYFIAFDPGVLTAARLETLGEITYETRDHTVGARSISKPDVIRKLNEVLER